MAKVKAKVTPPVSKQISIVVLKGSAAYRDWLGRLTEYSRMPGAVLIDRALMEWAERNGFNEKPPHR